MPQEEIVIPSSGISLLDIFQLGIPDMSGFKTQPPDDFQPVMILNADYRPKLMPEETYTATYLVPMPMLAALHGQLAFYRAHVLTPEQRARFDAIASATVHEAVEQAKE